MMNEPQNHSKKKELIYIALIISAALVLGHHYYIQINRPALNLRIDIHDEILNHTAKSPYRYRILIPFAAEIFIKGLSFIIPREASFLIVYAVFEFASLTAMLLLLFKYLKIWFTSEQALIGILFASSTMIIAMRDHYYQPWSFVEPVLFTLAMYYLYKDKFKLFSLIFFLECFNRETAVFLVLIFAFVSSDIKPPFELRQLLQIKKNFSKVAGLFILWAIIYLGIRHKQGGSAEGMDLIKLWFNNVAWGNLLKAAIQVGLFLGAFWFCIIKGIRQSPIFIYRASLIIPFYIAVILIFGVWLEVRMLMPLYPILLPLGLSYIFPSEITYKK